MADMDSALVNFLLEDYPKHRGKMAEQIKPLRREDPRYKETFELHDDPGKKEAILCYKEKGEAVIQNESNTCVEIIDIEEYIKQFPEEKNEHGAKDERINYKCDFIIGPTDGEAFILFVELTKSTSENIRRSKATHAAWQLATSIDRFYRMGDFFDRYAKKTALFSYRVDDSKKLSRKVVKNMTKMMTPTAEHLSWKAAMDVIKDHGFTFEQRIYPTPYVIE